MPREPKLREVDPEIQELAEKAREWCASEEGQATIHEICRRAREDEEAMRRAQSGQWGDFVATI